MAIPERKAEIMTALRTIETLCADMENFVGKALETVEKGGLMSLVVLEDKTRMLCEALADAAPEEGRQFLGKLDAVHRQLDLLKQMMEAQQEKIRAQLMSLESKKKANQAYAKSEAMTPKKKR